MTVSVEHTLTYKDCRASHIRITLMIRRFHGAVMFQMDQDVGEIRVDISHSGGLVVHFSEESPFECNPLTTITTIEEVAEIERDDPNEMLTAEELLKCGLYNQLENSV